MKLRQFRGRSVNLCGAESSRVRVRGAPKTDLLAPESSGVGGAAGAAATDPAMPAFDWKLSDSQVAAVATYIRTNWGNQASAVDASIVKNLRENLGGDSSTH